MKEEEILEILGDKKKLAAKIRENGVVFLRLVFDKLNKSAEFKNKVVALLKEAS
jgi:hypothetical protein